MSRRDSVRVILFARGTLIGVEGSVRCALVNVSAAGAMLTVTGALPTPPLRLKFELGAELIELPIEVRRVHRNGGVAVAFPSPHSERVHRLVAAEQRRMLALGRVNVVDRRSRGSSRAQRDDREPRPEQSGS